MKLNFTKEEHELFIKNHFQVVTVLTLDEDNELYYVIPVKENYTKDDVLIAKIQAEKFGFKVNDSCFVEDYKPENKTFCANYERDNNEVEYFYPEKPNSPNLGKNTNITETNLKDFKIKNNDISTTEIDKNALNYMYVKAEPFKEVCEDSIVEEIREKYLKRAKEGKLKYGISMDRNDLSIEDWLEHSIQEKMDDLLYMTKLKKDINKNIKYLIKQNLNDSDLGAVIRRIYS